MGFGKSGSTPIKERSGLPMKPTVVFCGAAGARFCFLTAALGFALHAHAAGGHHFVDDAALLEPGQCAVETCQVSTAHWPGSSLSLIHI